MSDTTIDGIDIKYADIEILKKLRNEYHPDKFRGEFPNEEIRYKYDIVDKELSNRLNNTNNNELIKSHTELLIQQQKLMENLFIEKSRTDSEMAIKNDLNFYIAEYKESFKIPKISSTAFMGAMSFVFFAPETLSSHPILGPIISNDFPLIISLWVVSLIFFLYSFLILKRIERRDTKRINRIKSPIWQREIFIEFTYLHEDVGFSESKFIDYFIKHASIDRGLFGMNIPDDVIVNICRSIINEYEAKGQIEKSKSPSFDVCYRVCINK